jgi:hypothetical protein
MIIVSWGVRPGHPISNSFGTINDLLLQCNIPATTLLRCTIRIKDELSESLLPAGRAWTAPQGRVNDPLRLKVRQWRREWRDSRESKAAEDL